MELDLYFETFWIFILSIGTFALSSIVGVVSTYKLFHKPKEKKAVEPEKTVCPECGGVDGYHKNLCTLKETPLKQREPKCSVCGATGHYAKKCPNKEKNHVQPDETQ